MSKVEMLTPENCAIALIDYQPAMYQGIQSDDRLVVFSNAQVLAKTAEILRAHSPYGIQVRFSKWALGERASEAGTKVA